MILTVVFSFFGALGLALLFEILHDTLAQHYANKLSKDQLCKIYYCMIGITWFLNASLPWLVQFPALVGVGLSHVSLCRQSIQQITWREIIRNIVPALKDMMKRII